MGACDPSPGADSDALRGGPQCGNGIVEPGEGCDLGFANAPDGLCRADCQRPRCGDGMPNEGERCDDANDEDHDGCRNDCRRPLQSTWTRAPRGAELPEQIFGLALLPSGGVAVAGMGQEAAGALPRAWLADYAPDGELRWARWLPEDDAWESATARALAVDAEGDLWITGYTRGERHDDVWVTRCNPEGEPRWTFIEDFGGNRDRGVAIALYGDGAVVAGETLRHARDRDGLVLRFDSEGAREFTWRYDGPAGAIDDARAIAVTPDGGIVVGGGEDDLRGWWIAKLDAEGVPLGFSRQRGQVGAWVSALAVDEEGELWAAGTEVLAAPDAADPSTWHAQPWLARLDSAGTVRWIRSEPPEVAARREAFGVALDPGGGATVIGTDPIPGATCSRTFCPGRLWLVSYTAAGERRYWAIPEEMVRGEGRAIARSGEGSLWLGGARRLVLSEADAWLARYHEVPAAEVAP